MENFRWYPDLGKYASISYHVFERIMQMLTKEKWKMKKPCSWQYMMKGIPHAVRMKCPVS